MRRIQFNLADFECVISHVLQFYESSALQRIANNDNLVPVTFPVKEVFPHTQKRLKPLVASLEFWWDSNEIFGIPKGGLGKKRGVYLVQRGENVLLRHLDHAATIYGFFASLSQAVYKG